MLQVVEINAIEHLEATRLRWTSLLYKTRGGSFFHTLDWLKVYGRHFGDGQRLRVLLVYHGGNLLGILPLVVRREMTGVGADDVLTYPTFHPSQFCGPVGPNPTATLMASFKYLANEPRDWDLLSLGSIGEHDHGRTANALELAGLYPREVVHGMVSKICFDASWPHVRWPSKAIEQQHRNDSTALEGHRTPESFERIRPLGYSYGDDRSLEAVMEECFALHRTTEPSVALLRDIVTTASRLGMLDLNLLRLDNRLIAYSVNVHFDGAIQQLDVGRDTESVTFAAAAVLTRRMLQDSFARQDRCICFTDTNGGSATLPATQQLPVVHYEYRATTPLRARLTRLGEWLALR